jgi:hypothetical protein
MAQAREAPPGIGEPWHHDVPVTCFVAEDGERIAVVPVEDYER